MGRPRKPGRRDLPDNLIPRNRNVSGQIQTYWYWRDPRCGQERSLQCPGDRTLAVRRARELNSLVTRKLAEIFVQQIAESPFSGPPVMPFDVWAIEYLRRLERRELSKNTMKSRKSWINRAIGHFQSRPLHELAVDVRAFTNFFEIIEGQGKARSAQAMRSVLIDVFAEAHASGNLAASLPNPVKLTLNTKAEVKRARLTIEDLLTIWPHCEYLGARIGIWQPNSVLLALVTAQRREDIALFQFKRGRDWEAAWQAFQRKEKHDVHPYSFVEDDLLWVIQRKTGNLVRIPLDLRLNALKITVGEVIDRCRSNVASRHMLHHTRRFGNAPVGSHIHVDTISRQFAVVRDMTDLEWVGKEPPSFHELRSLSERLYRAQGVDTQTLLGHKTARMTQMYDDPRGAEWVTVKV